MRREIFYVTSSIFSKSHLHLLELNTDFGDVNEAATKVAAFFDNNLSKIC